MLCFLCVLPFFFITLYHAQLYDNLLLGILIVCDFFFCSSFTHSFCLKRSIPFCSLSSDRSAETMNSGRVFFAAAAAATAAVLNALLPPFEGQTS